jgi:hypothetical protein
MKKESNCNFCDKKFEYCDSQQTGKWCSNKCQMTAQYKTYINKWKQGHVDGNTGKYGLSSHIRRYLFDKHDSSCSKCGWNKKNPVTGKVPLHVDHKDGDSKNNLESNIQLLCPNCHSLTPNFGILNKGNGRYLKNDAVHPSKK